MEQFRGKIAIVTGAASGIGREVSRQLIEAGATVVLADIDLARAEEVARQLGKAAQAAQLDVSDAPAVQRLVEEVVAQHGRLDFMFNNAGFAVGGEVRDMTVEQWNRIIAVNLGGVVNGVMAAYPVMIRQGHGHIVNTASLAGLIASPGLTAYSTTKHAVVGLSLALRAEAAGLGVKVSAVCPSFINTNIFEAGVYNKIDARIARLVIPLPFINVDQAARSILKGVAANRALIVFPRYAQLAWWLRRLVPGLIDLLNLKSAADLRKVRDKAS